MTDQPAAPQIKPVHAIAIAAAAMLLATIAVALLWLRKPEPARQLTLEPAIGAPAGATAGSDARAAADLEARPEVQAYRERQRFEQRIQAFVKQADGLSEAERRATLQSLEAEIGTLENARQLSAGEAMLLRMRLLSAAGGDPAANLQRAQALARQYRSDAERREAAFLQAQQNDPRFRRYKQREADIVAEVQAMERIPGGMDRDAYLRQRLQEAREAAYAQPAGTETPPAAPKPSSPSPAPSPAPPSSPAPGTAPSR